MADLTGQRLGQYLILERIAKGSTSTVYKAYQEKLERYVAVKVLSPHFIDEEGFLERFKREARAVARLDHSNILPIYDFDHVGDIVYIVMKHVDSGSLKAKMGNVMELQIVLEIFYQVGYALGYAHRQGVIHRDVKPGNILMGEGNWALLTDFGLAKIRAGDRKLTKSGIGMGTPDYMAPEQAQGLPVDGRADIYSLGCMLYEMVTSKVPFDADSGMAVVVKHITEAAPPPREVNPKLPLAVESVILRALEKDPNLRYQTAEAMVTDLARAIGHVDQMPLVTDAGLGSGMEMSGRASPPRGVDVSGTLTIAERTRAWWLRTRSALGPRLRHVWSAIKAGLASLIALLKRIGIAIWRGLVRIATAVKMGAIALIARVRAQTVEAAETKAPVKRTRKTATKSTKKITTKTTKKSKPTAKRQKSDSEETGVGAFGVSARERIDRRQIVGVLLGLLLLFLLVTLVVFPPATSDAQVRTSPTSVVASSTATEVVTEQALEVPTDSPSPSPEPSLESATQEEPTVTITPLPQAPAGMVTVAGGTFKMGGSKGRFDPDETPPHWITLNPYYIDTVEATVAQFARFVASSGHVTEAEQSGSATDWQQFNNPDQQRFPVMRVSWNDATRYCAWFGKRLPTEAEWELASKGHTDRIYPWGYTYASSLANTQEYAAGQPIAIATLGNRSVYGAYDMVGNVWEWVADWYGGGYYASSPSVNPRGPGSGSERVIRGGSFNTQGERATTTVRGKANPAGWSDDIGFRCVRDIPQSEE